MRRASAKIADGKRADPFESTIHFNGKSPVRYLDLFSIQKVGEHSGFLPRKLADLLR
jgi:hypothetical protein